MRRNCSLWQLYLGASGYYYTQSWVEHRRTLRVLDDFNLPCTLVPPPPFMLSFRTLLFIQKLEWQPDNIFVWQHIFGGWNFTSTVSILLASNALYALVLCVKSLDPGSSIYIIKQKFVHVLNGWVGFGDSCGHEMHGNSARAVLLDFSNSRVARHDFDGSKK